MTVKYTATDGATEGNPAAIREGLEGLLATYSGLCNAIWSAKYDLSPPKGEEELLLWKAKTQIVKRLRSYPEGEKIWQNRFEIWRKQQND